MNKAELVAAVAERLDVTKRETEMILNAILDEIVQEVANGGEVRLVNFGSFKTVRKAARVARNPKTGEEIGLAETIVPKFKPGLALKDAAREAF